MSHVVAERNGTRLTLRARELRGERTLVEASELVGIRQDELSRIERGETSSMRFETLLRLCEAYDVPPGELLAVEKEASLMSPLERVLEAVATGTVLTHRPPRTRSRQTVELVPDEAERAEVVMERDAPVRRARRRAPRTAGQA